MRVAVDARRLQDRPLTGVGRWIANLVPILVANTELVLLTDARRPAVMGPCRELRLGAPPRLPEAVWLEWSAARWWRRNAAIFHGTFNAIPAAGRGRSVVTIHDLSFEVHPEDFGRAKRRLFAVQARSAARRADVILTVSEHARQSIIAIYGADPERVMVAPNAVDPVFSDETADEGWLRARGYGGDRYVVAIGGARRRGLEVAIEAWREARRQLPGLSLVVVGTDAPACKDDVIYLGRVADRRWASVLVGASALCYPTRFEGFGIPALEAAACGVPVVCGEVGPLPEVLGQAAEWCDHRDPGSVGAALLRVLGDGQRHDQLSLAGRARAQGAPTWRDSAAVVLEAYRRAGA